ncbi:alpha/beta hydrolase [uncultured Tessaracoccus sp.]|uniref:alpha/beta hydrolase n=1 Tax=uncultured Tessaracoccus sp. TaxID=905023 RepID=UPI0025EBA70F|nr:alpha/beta hydrolase [uncultured Tessaracoccus sp.]
MDRRLRLTQLVIGVLCVGLVLSLFSFGLVGGGQTQDRPAPSAEPTSQPPRKVDQGMRMPGTPARSLDSLELLDLPGARNPDRQTSYRGKGGSITFPEALPDLRAYAEQPIDWQPCGDILCATVLAPLDWDEPGKAAVTLAVTKVPSADPKQDPLFVNPGGPGAGGTEFAAQFPADHWPGHDIVGWDPRGTGHSTHVVCGSTEQTDAFTTMDHSPDDAKEDRELRARSEAFARQCRDGSGELLDHLTTVDVVRDMDLLRHVLGGDKLHFVGVSYGTFLGAMYATLFPDTSGRLVLDGAVEITDAEPVSQLVGFERAFTAWADWCASQEACVLHGKSSEALRTEISDWLAGLDTSPLTTGNRTLTQTNAALGIAFLLYGDSAVYRTLAEVIRDAMRGDGAPLLAAADEMTGRRKDGYDTLAFAFPAMGCVDSPDEGVAATKRRAEREARKAPTLGRHMGWDYTCETWAVDPLPPYKLDAKDADPILVVGATGDPATPYEQAERMAKQLRPARLLTLEGPGHGAVTGSNECIAKAVGRYLSDGTLPDEGTRCT